MSSSFGMRLLDGGTRIAGDGTLISTQSRFAFPDSEGVSKEAKDIIKK